jgi:hypothetical protein
MVARAHGRRHSAAETRARRVGVAPAGLTGLAGFT